MTDRAVSNMVGFVLIFGIIMTGAVFALVLGQGAIQEATGFQQSQNAERAMILLGQDIDHLSFSRSASATNAMNIDQGQLRYGTHASVDVTVENAMGATTDFTVPVGSIVYEMEGTTLRYENGVVLRADGDSGVALTEPEISCDDGNRAIVSMVKLQGDPQRQLGSGRVTINSFLNGTALVYPQNRSGVDSATDATEVTIDVRTHRDEAWSEVLTEAGWDPGGSGTFTCEVGPSGSVYVRRALVDIRFIR